MAEHVFGLVPPGTHDHSKYVKPEELMSFVSENGLSVLDMTGIHLNPFTIDWSLEPPVDLFGDIKMNYMLAAKKPDDASLSDNSSDMKNEL